MYKKRKAGKIFLIIFILLVLAGGAGAYYYFFIANSGSVESKQVVVTLNTSGGEIDGDLCGFVYGENGYQKTLRTEQAYGELPKLKKAGYVFVGWSLSGVEPCIQPAAAVTANSDFTLIAVFEEERIYTYKIYYAVYDVDTGSVYATMLRQPVTGTALNRTVVVPDKLKFDGYTLFEGETSDGKSSDLKCELIADGMLLFMYYTANLYTIKYTYSDIGATYSKATTFKYTSNRLSQVRLRPIAEIQAENSQFIVNGKTFSHWKINSKTFSDGASVMRSDLTAMGFSLDLTNGGISEVSLNAVYKESDFDVTYMSQGEVYLTTQAKFQSHLTAPVNPSPTGYTFVGWYNVDTGETGTQISGLTKVNFKTFQMPSQNCTLYAGYTLISYNLNLNIGEYGYYSGAHNPIIGTIESDFALIYPDTHQRGYTFAGWTGEGLTEPTMDVRITAMTAERSYTATYKEKVYTISYDLAGGQLAAGITNPTEFKVSTDDFTLNNPEKRGYTFTGWQLNGETQVNATVTISKGSIDNREYTAKYTPILYNITYDLIHDGARFDQIQKDAFTIEDDPYVVDTPICEGYDFVNWEVDGAVLRDGLLTFAGRYGDIIVTAVWTLHSYSITYNLNGGSCTNPSTYTIETETFTLNNPTLTGYEFIGWTGSNGTMPQTVVTIGKGTSKSDLEFVANYTPINYLITYYGVDSATFAGSETNPNPTSYNVETSTFALLNPEKEGYTFAGWKYTYAGETQTLMNVEIARGAFIGDLEFTATFTLKQYTITLILAGGKLPSGNSTIMYYNVEMADFVLPKPTRDGYSFTGWRESITDAVAVDMTIDTSRAKDLTFTAQWNLVSYNIIYELNGGRFKDGDTPPQSYRVIDDDIAPPTPLRDGYNFAGWTLYEKTSSDTWELMEDITTIYCDESTGDRRFVASWNARTDTLYSIEYRLQPLNGSTNLEEYVLHQTSNGTARTDADVTQSAITLAGFTAQEPSITLKVLGDGSTKFVFYYSRNKQNISASYDATSADGEGISGIAIANEYGASGNGDYYYGQTITVTVSVKDGYNYTGLFESGGNVSTRMVYTFTVGTADRAFVAKAQIITYTITYNVEEGALFNGSATNPNRTTYTVKDNFTLVNPMLAGTNFLGWSGTGISDKAQIVTINGSTGDRTYTAVFGDVEYTITYNYSGGSKVAGGNYPIVYTKKSADITPSALTKMGYTFTGWTLCDENGAELDGQTITSGSLGNRSYVANFTANANTPYVVKHYYMDANGQYNRTQPSDVENLTGTTDTTVSPEPKTMDGYVSPTKQTKTVAADGSMVIEYDYQRVSYEITITTVGEGITSVTETSLNYYWGRTVVLEVSLERGYSFAGWTQTAGTSVITNASAQRQEFTMPKSNLSFSVSAQIVTYTITYELGFGTLPAGQSNPTSYTVNTAAFTLVEPTMIGGEFTGWTSQSITTPTKNLTVEPSEECRNLAFTANYQAVEVSYTVKYYQMTVDGSDYTLISTDTAQKAMAGSTITVTPHATIGFKTPAAQSVSINPDGSTVVEFRYERNKYTVTLGQNTTNSGIDVLTGAGEYYYFADVTVTAALKQYYEFLGWEVGTTIVCEKLTYTFKLEEAQNYNLIARTKGQTFTITYDLNNSDPVDSKNNPTEYEHGVELSIADPTCATSNFLGWIEVNSEDKVAKKNITIGAGSIGNATLKAYWGKTYQKVNYLIKTDESGNEYVAACRNLLPYYIGGVDAPDNSPNNELEIPKYIIKSAGFTADNLPGLNFCQGYIVDEEFYENGNPNTYIVKEVEGYIDYNGGLRDLGFRNNSVFKKITVPDSVEKINMYAFASCVVEELNLPNSLTEIGDAAFYNCDNLQTLNLPSSLTKISEAAFNDCNGLQTINQETGLAGSTIEIGNFAFQSCGALQTINLSSSTITIGSYAFQNCNGLQTLSIPNGVTTIAEYAFHDCDSLQSVTLPASVESMGQGAFGFCENLTTINLSQTKITELSNSMFYKDVALKDVSLPSTLTTIGGNVFYLCKSLETISIPNSVTSIGRFAFSFCEKLSETGINASSQIQVFGEYSFQSCFSLLKFTLPSTINSIQSNVFHNCSKLYQITNLSNVTETQIKQYFLDTETNAAISTTGTFSNGTLSDNKTKKLVTLSKDGDIKLVHYYGTAKVLDLSGENFTSTGNGAFYRNMDLQEVIMPSTWNYFRSQTFFQCRNLMKCTVLSNATNYTYNTDGHVFDGCNKLVQLKIASDGVYDNYAAYFGIDATANKGFECIKSSGAFQNAITTSGDIITFTIASGEDAGTYFMGYTGTAKTLDLSTYSKLYASGLAGCVTLESVILPSAITSISDSFFDACYRIKGVTLPSAVVAIGEYAFNECYTLETIALPSVITVICESTFSDCIDLNDIVIPDSVTEIEKNAFRGCFSLTKCKLSANVTIIGEYVFQGCPLSYKENNEYYFVVPSGATVDPTAFKDGRDDLESAYGTSA